MRELLSPLVAILGVILGASAQYVFSRLSENRRSYDKLRTDSYVDFIKGCAGIAMAQRFQNHTEEMNASALMLDAKANCHLRGCQHFARCGQVFREVWRFLKERGQPSICRPNVPNAPPRDRKH